MLALVRPSLCFIRDNSDQSLLIGCLPLFSLNLIPRVTSRLQASEQQFRLGVYPLDHPTLLRDLLALRYELGVVEVGVPVDGMEVEEIVVGQEVCILPAGHRLAGKNLIAPGDLDDEVLIS